MTDLRNTLKRASETSGSESLDHGAVSQKVRRVVRRRRAMYAAGAGLSVLVLGFSALQIAEGNWFGRTVVNSDDVATQPEELTTEMHLTPRKPRVGEEVSFVLENLSEVPITVAP